MKIRKEKRTVFIEADSAHQFDQMLNEALQNKVDAQVQIYGLYKGAIIHTEIITYEEDETIADIFEKLGMGLKCIDCPNYVPSKDKRVKWIKCDKVKRKIQGTSRACDDLYKERRINEKAG